MLAWSATLLLGTWGLWRISTATAAGVVPPPLPAPALVAPPRTSAPPGTARPVDVPLLGRSSPTKITIRSIGLRAHLDQIGMEPNGTIETPSYEKAQRAAWYRLGPSPGEPGPAVILGHVDSKKKVAVFFYLTRMRPGDEIEVARADGRTAVFTVTSVEQFAKTDFPTERVYGATEVPALRLITCGGRYDAQRQAYLDNIVVLADLTNVRRTRR